IRWKSGLGKRLIPPGLIASNTIGIPGQSHEKRIGARSSLISCMRFDTLEERILSDRLDGYVTATPLCGHFNLRGVPLRHRKIRRIYAMPLLHLVCWLIKSTVDVLG